MHKALSKASVGFSRIRGGDPRETCNKQGYPEVFPAYAGVILNKLKAYRERRGFSRIRGGDPN